MIQEEGWRLAALVVRFGWLHHTRLSLPFSAVAQVTPRRVQAAGTGSPAAPHPPGAFTFDAAARVQLVERRMVQRTFWFWGLVLAPEGDAVASLVVRSQPRSREPLIFPTKGATCQRHEWIWVPAVELEPALLAGALAR